MKKLNLSIFIPSTILAIFGLVTLASTEIISSEFNLNNIFIKQLLFVFIGIVVFFITLKFDVSLVKYRPLIVGIYGVTLLLLIMTLVLGQEVNGAKRWLSILGVQLQPSEIAKITVILTTAYIFSLREKYNEYILFLASFLALLPILLLIYLEPHGSMTGIILILWLVMSFISLSNPLRNTILVITFLLVFSGLFMFTAFGNAIFLLLSLLGLIIGIFSFFSNDGWRIPFVLVVLLSTFLGGIGSIIWNNVLSDYQKERITAFQDPTANSATSAFNVEQSKIAIGSGGVFGKGFANGSQTRLKILPFYQTDFIFATYAEEFGLIGSLVLFGLYIYILFNTFIIGISYPQYAFETSILAVVGIKILIEVFINLGTNLGVIPATGIPLPLMSAGGSITIMTFFSLGLIQCIITNVKEREQYKLKS